MVDLNTLGLDDLYHELRRAGSDARGSGGGSGSGGGIITRLIELARDEDLGESWESGDVTTAAFVPSWKKMQGRIVARSSGVAAGVACLAEVLDVYRADVDVKVLVKDGESFEGGTCLAELTGLAGKMITAERVMLNLLGRLCGIATRTRAFADAAAKGAPAGMKGPGGEHIGRVFDTRKTTPGMRLLEKYAVRCGGGYCHRLGLFDAVLIKDNHLAAVMAGGATGGPTGTLTGALTGSTPGGGLGSIVKSAVKRARSEAPVHGLRFVMLEVDRFEQFEQVLLGGAAGRNEEQVGIILLDNMTPEELQRCVQLRNEMKVPVELEASGGVNLNTIGSIAATGVDRISTGSLTHGATWLDVGLDAGGV